MDLSGEAGDDGDPAAAVERFVFRYELEHLLARSGFRVESLFGDYDGSEFGDASLGMIVAAKPLND